MAKSTNKNSNDANASPQNPQQQNHGSRTWIYIAIGIIAIVLIVIAYLALTAPGNQSLSSSQILDNVSSSNLNQTQALFVNDLKNSENVGTLYIQYYSRNATRYITESSNLTVAISSNQTIDSYKLNNYNKTIYRNEIAYTNSANGEVMAENLSYLYYYSPDNITNSSMAGKQVTCINETAYSAGLVTNSSLQCGYGDQGNSYLEETPFTAVNVSSLSYLVFNNTVTYSGIRTIAGRSCDNFIITNATASNIQSNYSVFDFCVDRQYGVPLYYNQTYVTGGVPSSFSFTATLVSTNVTGADFAIPQSYLNTIQKSII